MSQYSLFTDDLEYILEYTRDAWEDLRGERIFITGGTGFFGMWLLESFLWANDRLDLGAQAVVLSRDPRAFCQKQPHLADAVALSFHQGDVRNFAFPDGYFASIIHAATEASARLIAEEPLLMSDTIIDGTRRALEFARHCRAGRFLLTSSGAVYGRQPPEVAHLGEDYPGAPDPMDPLSCYGLAKRMAEHQAVLYARRYGIDAKIARCFAFAGPYLPLDAHFAVGNFICDALKGGPIRVKGDGTALRSYLYAADLAVWLWTILFRGQSCRPYNVGAEHAVSIAELADIVSNSFQEHMTVKIAQTAKPGDCPQRYVPSIRRAQTELGLRAVVQLEAAVGRMAQWYSQQGALSCQLQSTM